MNKPPFTPFTRSPFTTQLIDLFKGTEPGALVAYSQISAELKAPRERWGHLMPTVRRVLLREHQIALITERGAGYRHALDADMPGVAEGRVKSIRRAVKKAAIELAYGVKEYDKLGRAQQVEFNLRTAQFGVLHQAVSRPAERKLRDHIEVQNDHLDIGATLALLKD